MIDPLLFSEDLESRSEEYYAKRATSFRDLPIDDNEIMTIEFVATKDSRDCMILALGPKDDPRIKVHASERLHKEIFPHQYKHISIILSQSLEKKLKSVT